MADSDPIRIVSRIKNNRLLILWEQSGMTVSTFAQSLGISLNSWYQLTSLTKYPGEKLISKISEATGLSGDELFPGFLKRISKNVAVRTIPEAQLVALEEARYLALPPAQIDDIEKKELAERMDGVLRTLSPREEAIIKMRFGIDGEEYTLQEIALRLSVTKERIRQIESRVMRKMRDPSRSEMLKGFLSSNNS